MRIAMWSGPRNLSTAMMYSFAARGDCAVIDEPFYAAYLTMTGLEHPMRDEIIASQPSEPAEVVAGLMGSIPRRKQHFYHKHMAQHMIDGVPRDWIRDVVNVFLIRHPARVVASFSAKYEKPTLDDIGFRQQAELFDQVKALDGDPVVIDSADIRRDPEGHLRSLCERIGLDWTPDMLHWPEGGHADDGVWASHWYGAVHGSSGFAPAEGDVPELTGWKAELSAAAMPYYEALRAHSVKAPLQG
ncbi:HAD family hydrolase [Roseovarius sp.]|uniref:sulfotransferase-like domain-containing protein n=1 Tax=Roseovarius sp. TaxID=1486281 RepID=UPI003D0E6EED